MQMSVAGLLLALQAAATAGGVSADAGAASGGGGCGAIALASVGYHGSGGQQQPQLMEDPGGSSFTFGTHRFAMTFDRATLDLLNVTTCSADGRRQQDFLWKDTVGAGAQSAPGRSRFSLWQLTYSNCSRTVPWPQGNELDGLANASAGRNYSVTAAPDGGHVLALRWQGMPLVPGHRMAGEPDLDPSRRLRYDGSTLDVTVKVTMRSGSALAQLRGSVVAHGSAVCLQSLVLPNLDRLVLRSPAQDVMFTPWFFGQIGDQSALCGGGDCTLELAGTAVQQGEYSLMPNGNERSMQFAALYSRTPSPSTTAAAPAPAPLGLYIGAHSPDADLMSLTTQGSYCPPPLPPGFSPNKFDINATIRHGVDTGSAGGDLGSVGKMADWPACARKCGVDPLCRSFVWNNHTLWCYPKSRVGVPRAYGPASAPDVYGCSPSYPAATCVAGPPPPPPPSAGTDCGSHAAARWYHFPNNTLVPLGDGDDWTLPYDVVLAGFEGDWFDAAMIYRGWALREATWTKPGNLSTRARDPSYPHWLLEAPLWTQVFTNLTNGSWLQQNTDLAAALGTPIGTHWYQWEVETFDTHYPVYTPRPGFAAATATMQAATPPVHVVPYTNGRLFDPRDPKYKADNAEGAACYRPSGSSGSSSSSHSSSNTVQRLPYTESYEAGRDWRFVAMDPSTEYWQTTIAGAVGAAAAAGNTSGVYIDQIASYYAQSCFNETHSGGGSRWADGNRAVLEKAIKAVGPGRVIISESNAEAYIGSLHAFLAIYGWRECGVVPAFQAVYGGYSVNVGSVTWPNDVLGIRIVLAQQWSFGHVMGWTSPSVFLANNETLGFTRELAQLKVKHAAHLTYGRLMRPPTLTAANGDALRETTWCAPQGSHHTCCPAASVIGQLWMDNEGTLGLALANPTNETVSVAAALRVDGHTQLAARGHALVDGEPARVGETHLRLARTLQPLSACVVSVQPQAWANGNYE